MQNFVHRTRESAVDAQNGELVLAVCGTCGFAWNRMFEPDRLAVPSAVMHAYYAEIVAYLRNRYPLDGGLVVDVGCGDGGFLTAICDAVPGLRGIGVDPALAAGRSDEDGRIVLIKDVFTADVIRQQPSLVVSRHVLEHIPQPVEFFRMIREALAVFDPRPCFFEFPDLEWILANHAFWDFGYEHCNYFTEGSATEALRRAGFGHVDTRAAFGSQYLWVEAGSHGGQAVSPPLRGRDLIERASAYAHDERTRIELVRARLRELKSSGQDVVVWGMATKGVLFSLLIDPDSELINYCIDVNPNKRDCYVPLTGHVIRAPNVLAHELNRELAVIVMNENYSDEIQQACRGLGLDPAFFDGNIEPLLRP
jgi:SAM-dependent methyltransferase